MGAKAIRREHGRGEADPGLCKERGGGQADWSRGLGGIGVGDVG